jgi:hypothetical protein
VADLLGEALGEESGGGESDPTVYYQNSITLKSGTFFGEYIAHGSEDKAVYIWQLPDRRAGDLESWTPFTPIRPAKRLKGHLSIVNCVAAPAVPRAAQPRQLQVACLALG